ncbi:MAG: radical SAM protein [Candidatus Villigracilaceae bacterium]
MIKPPPDAPLLLTALQSVYEDDCACPESPHLFVSDAQAARFENDCACPLPPQTYETEQVVSSLYSQAPEVYSETLAPGFKLIWSSFTPQGPSVVNQAAWERWQEFRRPQPLSQPIDALLAKQNLLLPAKSPARPASAFQPETLTVWLHVTNACNLDCPYCYVRKSSAAMSEATGLQAIQKVFQTAQKRLFRRVKLKYAGGEATLNFKLVKTLADQAQRLAAKSGLGLDQVVLSNGTHLRPEDVQWLQVNGIRLMISLDGIGAVHDRLRSDRRGNGSFAMVSRTIDDLLLPHGLIPNITITITRQNANGVADAVRWALARNLPVSLNFYRQASNAARELVAEENALIEGMLAAYRVYEEMLPDRPFLNGLLDRVQMGTHLHTCGVGTSYLVITDQGAVAQCQMLLEDSVLPTRTNDLLEAVQEGPIQNLSVDQKITCQKCPWRYICSGGCPLETYRATGKWDAPSPNCRIYKTLLPAALRLEGLRLLKVNGYLL